ncbi:hypothetical protein JRQ81_012668 [Phrynocephalus forsythii]|uniref:Uncharacterized protein n=1 Tax=Phrynocephalus forsythii TaxID=171643 RepID=A0A9Q1B5Y9_9SAUR|nr:hypothetical protein JRQ81_012668 [Phrynocephalus forsythii]
MISRILNLRMSMAERLPQLLIAAAWHHLSMGKKKALSPVASLNLAGEVLAVAAGLKPAFLYDYNSAGISQVLSYVRQLETISHFAHWLHILSIAENILIINLEIMPLLLETILTRNSVSFIDVSASRTCPSLCNAEDVTLIKGHISEILRHIKTVAADTSKEFSSSAIFSAGWHLCTVFGSLLGYPAAYSFPA